MKAPLTVSALAVLLFSFQPQCNAQDNSSLAVLDFKWSRWHKPLDAEPVWDTSPTPARPPMREEDRKIVERRYGDLMRSADLRKMERDAMKNSKRPLELYTYKVKTQNANAKTIKTIFWEYQVVEAASPENLSRRQFVCTTQIKSNQKKELAGISFSPPFKVISAKSLANDAKPFEERAVINRLEFADGSIWQRNDWTAPHPSTLPMVEAYAGYHVPECLGF